MIAFCTLTAAALLAAPMVASAATTIQVDDTGGVDAPGCGTGANPPCLTIGFAHGQAVNGDTINVAAGTYPQRVDITKSVTLTGAKAGQDARTRTTGGESILNGPTGSLQLSAGNVRVDGFTVRDTVAANPQGGAGIYATSTGAGRQIVNTIFTGNIQGLYVNSNDGATTIVRHNKFDANTGTGPAGETGLYSDQGLINALIDENSFTGNPNSGVILDKFTSAVSNVQLTGNTGSDPILVFTGQDITVERNKLAIDDDSSSILLGSVQGASVRDNTITGGQRSGVRIIDTGGGGGPSQDIDVIGNTITGNNTGNNAGLGGVSVGDGGYAGLLDVHFNRIVGNTGSGATSTAADATVNAEDNWWGCNAGPGAPGCDTAVGVDADPWLVLGLRATPTTVQTGAVSNLTADLSVDSDGFDYAAPPFPRTPVTFAATAGTVQSPGTLQDGGASSAFTAPTTQQSVTATATVDGQDATTVIAVANPVNGSNGAAGPAGPGGPQSQSGTGGVLGETVVGPGLQLAIDRKRTKGRKVVVRARCRGTRGKCRGALNLVTRVGGRNVTVAKKSFSVSVGRLTLVRMTLNRQARVLLGRRGRLPLGVRTKGVKLGSQQLTATTRVTLRKKR